MTERIELEAVEMDDGVYFLPGPGYGVELPDAGVYKLVKIVEKNDALAVKITDPNTIQRVLDVQTEIYQEIGREAGLLPDECFNPRENREYSTELD